MHYQTLAKHIREYLQQHPDAQDKLIDLVRDQGPPPREPYGPRCVIICSDAATWVRHVQNLGRHGTVKSCDNPIRKHLAFGALSPDGSKFVSVYALPLRSFRQTREQLDPTVRTNLESPRGRAAFADYINSQATP